MENNGRVYYGQHSYNSLTLKLLHEPKNIHAPDGRGGNGPVVANHARIF